MPLPFDTLPRTERPNEGPRQRQRRDAENGITAALLSRGEPKMAQPSSTTFGWRGRMGSKE
eukprot:503462-Pyramimonas_sp.AAC.1